MTWMYSHLSDSGELQFLLSSNTTGETKFVQIKGGTLDSTFGQNGSKGVDLQPGAGELPRIASVLRDNEGRLLVLVHFLNPATAGVLRREIVRLTQGGDFDQAFGVGGRKPLVEPSGIAAAQVNFWTAELLSDGSFVIYWALPNQEKALALYSPDGSLSKYVRGILLPLRSLVIDSDDGIVMNMGIGNNSDNAKLIRYTKDLVRDSSFGSGGEVDLGFNIDSHSLLWFGGKILSFNSKTTEFSFFTHKGLPEGAKVAIADGIETPAWYLTPLEGKLYVQFIVLGTEEFHDGTKKNKTFVGRLLPSGGWDKQ